MQDSITHEALEALNQKASDARKAYDAHPDHDTLCALLEHEKRFGYALADLYRTGQLIHAVPSGTRKFSLGDRVTKTKGSSWTGLVVGFYSTSLTPIGYAVESENEPGSVQIYPESALEACLKARENGDV